MTTLIAIKRLRTFPEMTRRCIRYSSFSTPHSLQDKLRHLMVHCAQPVAIVTTRLRQHHPQGQMDERGQLKDEIDNIHEFHGATISSFSSIAMHPYPLVAFSLQLPSRLANALHAHTPSGVQLEAKSTAAAISAPPPAHFVINFLSTTQKDTAHRFSRPDLYPHPLVGVGENSVKLTKEDQPMLVDSVGCISCAVVHSLRLDGPTVLGEENLPGHKNDGECEEKWRSDGGNRREGKQIGIWKEPRTTPSSTSELFIARVIRVETLHPPNTGVGESRMPLVYFRKEYTTAVPLGAGGAVGTS